jgi:hypothetical protein
MKFGFPDNCVERESLRRRNAPRAESARASWCPPSRYAKRDRGKLAIEASQQESVD